MFFGALEALVVAVGLSMIDTVRRSARPHDAVATGLEALADLARDLERDRIVLVLVLVRLRARIEEQLDLVGLKEVTGCHHFYPSVHAAVDGYAHDRDAVPG